MTTTMRRQICLVLVGLLVFVTRETDSFAIHSDERRGIDSIESRESLPDQVFVTTQQLPANGQIISKYSDEHDDFSLERVHVGAVLGSPAAGQPTQTTNNGPAGQVTRVQTPNIPNPVLIHSDEHDTFSDEVSLAGILANVQSGPAQTVISGGQEPNRGKRIFKQPDERHIVSARPGKQVIIRPGATSGSPIQTTSIHKATYRHSDEHDDYSDEVRSILASSSSTLNAPANNAGQLPNIPSPVYRLRSGERQSLPWREGEDDIQVQVDPVTKQVVNIRTELRDSLEHDVYFSDQVRSRIAALPATPPNANVQTPFAVNGRLISQHSDELYDASYEVARRILNQQNGHNLTAPAQGVRLISRHSDEHDDSLEIVRGVGNGQIRPAVVLPVHTALTGEHIISRHSDDVDDISLELHGAIRPGQSPISVVGGPVINVATGVEHLLRHSEEHDSSIELVGRIGNLPHNIQNLTAMQNQGVHLIQRHSDEHDDTSLEVLLVRNQTTSGQGVHLISRHSDEHDDASLEVIRHSLHPQNGQQNPTAPAQGVHVISRHSDEFDDTSLEVHLIRNQSAPGQIRLLKHSDEHLDTSLEVTGSILNLQNGQITARVNPVQTVIPGEHLIDHSVEVEDVSLEIRHVTPGVQPPIGGIVAAGTPTGVEHLLRHSDEQHDISLEDVIRRAPNPSQIGMAVPVQQGILSRDSDELQDLSLEVDINLLPEIQRLFTNARTDFGGVLPVEVQTSAAAAVTTSTAVNQGNQAAQQRMSRVLKQNVSLELQEILANPVFQQKIQEIDSRLKSAPDSRGKRLIEKYAEALALSSPSFNASSSTINSSVYLSILITWVLVFIL